MNSIKEICEKIWYLEEKHDLLDFELDSIKIWHFLRMYLYYTVARKTGVLADPHPKVKNTFADKIRNGWQGLISKNPYFGSAAREVLVFDHPRKVKVGDDYIDLYTHDFIQELENKKISHEIYEESYSSRHWTKAHKNRKHLDVLHFFSNKYIRFVPLKIDEGKKEKVDRLKAELEEIFSIQLDLWKIFNFQAKRFKAEHWFYTKLLKKKKPKRIYLVINYGLMPLIKAAKDLGVETIEFQHGTFSNYHLGYHFPGKKNRLEYIPDKFLVWEDFWKRMCSLPFEEKNVEVYGFKHLENEKKQYSGIKKNPNQIIIVSQGVLGEKLANLILKNIEGLSPFTIFYKLHPSEFQVWRRYPSLLKLAEFPNVKILDDNQIPLYRLLAESTYLIGVFSTVIYEGLHFGCEILLVDLPGIEYMKNLLDTKKARMFRTPLSQKEAAFLA